MERTHNPPVSSKEQHVLAYSDNKRSVLIRISKLINLPRKQEPLETDGEKKMIEE